MIFATDKQISEVCMVLLSYSTKDDLWNAFGPTNEGVDLYDANGGYLSSGEWALLAFCFTLWNGGKNGRMNQLAQLDLSHRERIGLLIACQSTHEVDAWIAKHENR